MQTHRTSSGAFDGRRPPRPLPATNRRQGNSHDSIGRAQRDRVSEERLEQPVGKRAYGELSYEPDQIWRKTAMSGPGPNRILIAREGGGEQGANVKFLFLIAVAMWSATAPPPPAASSLQKPSKAPVRIGIGRGIGSPASRRYAARKLGDDVVRRQGEARDGRTFECLFQVEDEREKAALQCHSRAELGAGSQYGVPAFIGGGLQLFASGGREVDIWHFRVRISQRGTADCGRKTLYYRGFLL